MKIVLLISSLYFLISCKGNFGNKVSDFVDEEVPALSEKIADSGLKRRLHEAYFTSLAVSSLEVRAILDYLKSVNVNQSLVGELNNFNQSKTAYRKILKVEANFMRALRDLAQLFEKTQALKSLCGNGNQHSLKDVIQTDIFSMSIPDKVNSAGLYGSWEETVIRNTIEAFSNENTNQQIGVMEAALKKIPEKIISQEKLNILFLQNCEDAKRKLRVLNYVEQDEQYIEKIEEFALRKLRVLDKLKKYVAQKYFYFHEQVIRRRLGIDVFERRYLLGQQVYDQIRILTDRWTESRRSLRQASNIQELNQLFENCQRQGHGLVRLLEAIETEIDVSGFKSGIERSLQVNAILYDLRKKIIEESL